MIKTFKHKGLKDFFESGSKAGIRPDHASKLSRQLVRLDIAKVLNTKSMESDPIDLVPLINPPSFAAALSLD